MLGWLKLLVFGENRILAELAEMRMRLKRMESKMATQADVDAIVARLDTVSSSVEAGVAGIRQDIQDLKDAAPADLDFTALDASVAKLESDVQGVTDLDAENPAAPANPDQPTV